MKKSTWHLTAVAVLLLPTAGCLQSLSFGLRDSGTQPSPNSGELAPKDAAQVCLKLGDSFEQNGYYGEAIVQFEKARGFDAKLTNLSRRLAVLYARAGYTQKAIKEFETALKATPKDADLLNDFGYCYYTANQWADAEAQFRKAVAINAKLERAWVNLGLCLAQQEKYPEAFTAFQKGCTPAETHANLGFVLASQGKREEAKKEYRMALDKDPNMVVAKAALMKLENPTPVQAANNKAVMANVRRPTPQVSEESEKSPDMSPMTIGPRHGE